MEFTYTLEIQANNKAEADLKAEALKKIADKVSLSNIVYMAELTSNPKFNQGFESKTARSLIKSYL